MRAATYNKALHQPRRQGVPASRAVVEGRLAGEGRCSTGRRARGGRALLRVLGSATLATLLLGAEAPGLFDVPNAGMEPTIKSGTRIEADLSAYKTAADIQRGDVVVFRFPESPEHVFVKRVLGVAGDTVSGNQGRVSVNGQATSTEKVAVVVESIGRVRYRTIPGSCKEEAYNLRVPAGSFFVVGDNRCFSRDSRHWGFVPFALILGRVTRFN